MTHGSLQHEPTVRSAATRGAALRRSVLWAFTVPIISDRWDRLLSCCGGAAVLVLVAYTLFPQWGELTVYMAIMFFTAGPAGTLLPSASEPVLMAFGKLYRPVLLAGLAVPGIALAEWVNYRVFGAVLHARRLTSLREARLVRRATAWFAVQPFWTVTVCALTPVPFWTARTCAVLAGYPLWRFTVATVIGRFPRVFLIALVGSALPFTPQQIAITGVLLIGLAALVVARFIDSSMSARVAARLPPVAATGARAAGIAAAGS